ncbi:hypothetical protein BU24DRAFT_461271 [Aaosphaeria arxii CBS 175.79]|uniref:Uncharacterized protein n=1 Tax=Aaosphaeria arxii CBS 175.79 TaxID=1450172 RepID=A0A6A5Y037_9PLEO|nr:uncharacterized protein BU24DRAFT_461271 [Aaosphaeria arxii CBS 175.79]KAF2018321.1 hypothetical protein BU24DRAFT_461271 [Aaosphaeria arxii CBS 175.79]
MDNHHYTVPPSQLPAPSAEHRPAYHEYPPEEPPPSYDDATHSSHSPLLVGPPPDYGTYRAYPSPDVSSVASSDIEGTSRSLPEWVGQAMVVLCFLGIIYGFWRVVNDPNFGGLSS